MAGKRIAGKKIGKKQLNGLIPSHKLILCICTLLTVVGTYIYHSTVQLVTNAE